MGLLTLADGLIFSSILFAFGVLGIFINRNNIIVNLMCLEIILLAVNTNFVVFSNHLQDLSGQIFVVFILTITAIKAALGLSILILLYKRNINFSINKLNLLKG